MPDAVLIPTCRRRASPYLYSGADIRALMLAAATLRYPLRVATYQTLIGLLAASGMRVGEAIRLDRTNLDLTGGMITGRLRFIRALAAETRDSLLEEHGYLNMDLLNEHKREQVWQVGEATEQEEVTPGSTS